jgi:hypothetical protein
MQLQLVLILFKVASMHYPAIPGFERISLRIFAAAWTAGAVGEDSSSAVHTR